MLIDNESIFQLDLDFYMLHDRRIVNRIDDSLIRTHGEHLAPIRRSRGFVPDSFDFAEVDVMAAGADMNGCFAVSNRSNLYPSQYLGDLSYYGNEQFYKKTFEYFSDIFGIEDVEGVGVDLHPKYRSRKLGLEYAEDLDAEVFEIQHHWAHGASLLLEHDIDELICIAVDGTGYGEDGNSWGGEVLYCSATEYERLAHLEEFSLLGGEEAVKDPRRLVYAIERRFGEEPTFFEEEKRRILDKLMNSSVVTTSLGRLLDTVSCALDVSCRRGYEGEPAMKLERLQMRGNRNKKYDVWTEGNEIKTLEGFIEMKDDHGKRRNRACSYTSEVAREMAREAVRRAQDKNVDHIGISGGVSYNRPIVEDIREVVEEEGYDLLVQEKVPNGDMGVPVGQAHIAAESLIERG